MGWNGPSWRARIEIVSTARRGAVLTNGNGAVATEAGVRPKDADGPFRHDLSKSERMRIRELATEDHLAAGAVLCREGARAEAVFAVASGVIKLFKSLPGERRQVSRFLFPGDVLAVAGDAESYHSTAQAVTSATVWRFDRSDFVAMIDSCRSLGEALEARLWHELEAAREHMLLLARKSAEQKVASFLLGIARTGGGGARDSIHLAMTRRDIADHLGLEVETVSRALTGLQRRQLIAMPDPGHARVLERAELEAIAGGRRRAERARRQNRL